MIRVLFDLVKRKNRDIGYVIGSNKQLMYYIIKNNWHKNKNIKEVQLNDTFYLLYNGRLYNKSDIEESFCSVENELFGVKGVTEACIAELAIENFEVGENYVC